MFWKYATVAAVASLQTFIVLDGWPHLLPSVRKATFITSTTTGAVLPSDPIQAAHLCRNTGEQASGTNRICYYQCPGSGAAITVPISSFCPVSINQ